MQDFTWIAANAAEVRAVLTRLEMLMDLATYEERVHVYQVVRVARELRQRSEQLIDILERRQRRTAVRGE